MPRWPSESYQGQTAAAGSPDWLTDWPSPGVTRIPDQIKGLYDLLAAGCWLDIKIIKIIAWPTTDGVTVSPLLTLGLVLTHKLSDSHWLYSHHNFGFGLVIVFLGLRLATHHWLSATITLTTIHHVMSDSCCKYRLWIVLNLKIRNCNKVLCILSSLLFLPH